MKLYYTILLSLFFCTAYSQDEIATDRPDQTETADIVAKGRLQVESGFAHEQQSANARELTLPSTLWKYGINETLELRLITEFAFYKEADSTAQGLKPITIGLKVNLWHEKGIIPETSLIAQMQIPKLASKDFKAHYIAPDIRLLFQNTINDNIDIGYNAGAIWDGETAEPTFEYTFSPNIKLSDKFKVFAESFGYLLQHDKPDHWVDAGLMFLLTKDIQLDVAGAYELSAHNHYHGYYETIGVSFRI